MRQKLMVVQGKITVPNSKIVVNAKYWELLEGKVNTHEQLVTKLSIIAPSLDLKIHDSGIFFNDKPKSKLMSLAPEEALDALLSVTLFNIAALNSDKSNINGITDYFCQVTSELTYDLLKAMATTALYHKYSSELFKVIGKLFHSSLLHRVNFLSSLLHRVNFLSSWDKPGEEFLREVEKLKIESENLQSDFIPKDNINIVGLLFFSLQFEKDKEHLEINRNKSEQALKSQYIIKRSNMFRPSYKKVKLV